MKRLLAKIEERMDLTGTVEDDMIGETIRVSEFL